MEVRLSVGFDASHQVAERDRCRRQHGHHWTITAAIRNRSANSDDVGELIKAVDDIVNEWRNRDLNEMLPNFSATTPERLAPWIVERLAGSLSQLTLVEITDGVVTAVVHREPPLR